MRVLYFDEEDVPDRYEVIDHPATVLLHCQWCDIAWHYATPPREYAPNPVSVTPARGHCHPPSVALGGGSVVIPSPWLPLPCGFPPPPIPGCSSAVSGPPR